MNVERSIMSSPVELYPSVKIDNTYVAPTYIIPDF
jgi:hypothetical protein